MENGGIMWCRFKQAEEFSHGLAHEPRDAATMMLALQLWKCRHGRPRTRYQHHPTKNITAQKTVAAERKATCDKSEKLN